MASIFISEFIDDAPDDASLTKYSLNSPRYILEFKENDSDFEKILIGGSTDKGYYVKTNTAPNVYLVSTDALAFLDISPQSLLDQEVYTKPLGTISTIEFKDQASINLFKITSNGTTSEYYLNDKKITVEKFSPIYDKFMKIPIQGETKSIDGVPESTITITFASGGSADILEFIPYDIANYAVNINGATTHYVSKSYISDIFASVYQLSLE
jgi:hypothetical protein